MSEELIVRHCAPTLAGLKTGNLFRCSYRSEKELREMICKLNRRLAGKGLRILPLRMEAGKALIYVYRPMRLKEDLATAEAGGLLEPHGYCCRQPGKCVARLKDRLREQEDFPHEIGLFLGYPPEDVRGFIEQGGQCAKCGGCWKVYGDAEQAQKLFAQYKKCTAVYTRCFSDGRSLDRLTVAKSS